MEEDMIHSHSHHHHHSEESKKAVINRLSRAIGHLESVKRMIESDRDCSEVLVQLAAVRSAINNTSKVILKEHIDHCIIHAVQDGNMQVVEELEQAIEQFIK
ncbi:MAG: metal-sensing transcriptional repressor [Cellulosilyticum sp.]|nr:metal-sensing transcriptional repressor [Cellulosilyticum sp.]